MTTILFIVSLIALIGILASKIFETSSGKSSLFANLFSRGDVFIHAIIERATIRYNYWKKVANIFIFDFLPLYLHSKLVELKGHLVKRYYNALESFRGRRMLQGSGGVSAFLERLAEEKNNPTSAIGPRVENKF